MKKYVFAIFFLLNICTGGFSFACTTAVISGKATANGRPLLWKLRDADETENCMRFFNDGKYTYIGLINSNDIEGKNVWAGANSEGFAIMNNASFNVNIDDTVSLKDQEGVFMKLALQECATLADFEKLLDNHPKPHGLAANFGVIDGKGGAAYYEVDNYTYTKYDANDLETAPHGYLVRTNFSFIGKKDVGYGYIRYQTAEEIFQRADVQNKLNYRTIIQEFSRCFYHPVINVDYREKYSKIPRGKNFVHSDDLITRKGSVSSFIVQGVRDDEQTDLSTVWALVGFPETSVAVPVWIRGGDALPKTLVYDETIKTSRLNKYALEWKEKCYPIGRADGYHYLNISELVNKEGTGYVQRIEKLENIIFNKTDKVLAVWRKKNPSEEQIMEFYKEIDKLIDDFYKRE